jgi:hypothetical protein
VDNPQCKAVSATYIGADGKMLYFETLELDNEREVSGRLVRINKACEQGNPNCGGGCGRPSCFICLGGRCGCRSGRDQGECTASKIRTPLRGYGKRTHRRQSTIENGVAHPT